MILDLFAVFFKGFQYVVITVGLVILLLVGVFQYVFFMIGVVVVGVINFIHVGTFPYTVFKIGVGIVGDLAKVILEGVSVFEDMVADFIYVIFLLVFLFWVLAYVVVLVKVVVGSFVYVVIGIVAVLENVMKVSLDVLVFGAFQ